MHIGEILKQRRLELGWTQEDVAIKLGNSSRSSVNKIEKQEQPSLKIAKEYSRVLGLSLWDLISFDDDDTDVLVEKINSLNEFNKKHLINYVNMLLREQTSDD